MGVAIPQEHGGAGMDALSYALAMEEVSAACASCGVIMSVNNSLFCDPVYKFGTVEQKKRVLAPVARGEKLGCFGLTEPMSGSDAQTMVTARREGRRRLGPQRRQELDHQRPARRLDPRLRRDRPQRRDASSTRPFSSSAERPGFTQNAPDHKLGIHAAHSCTVFFENCNVPDANVLGHVGEGFKVAMATLDGGRIGIACQAIGIARAAFERSVAYAKERKSLRRPDRAAPGHPVHAGRHGDPDRRRAPAHLARRER